MIIRKRFGMENMISVGLCSVIYRFSEFEALRAELAMTFPKSGSALPPLPPKSLICGAV